MSRLAEIFAAKRREVDEAKAHVSRGELEDRASGMPGAIGFKRALTEASGIALIAEVKKASPSRGLIRPDFDAVEVALAYKRAGAQALSVLTDAPFFHGSPENLTQAKEATGLPCLRKDFIFDPYQVWEARAWGADAILLILAALSDEQMRELWSAANELELDVLSEVHDRKQADRAINLGCSLIGVNNRNLANFGTSLDPSLELLPLVAKHAVAVSESALENRRDVEKVRQAGAKAVLIGTTFCQSPDIESKVVEVMGW